VGTRIDPAWLAAQLPYRRPAELAADIAQLIRDGQLTAGDRLPPVRDLAGHLRVSASTVSSAWKQLKARGLAEGAGRSGTFITAGPATPRPSRFEREGDYGEHLRFTLSLSVPDTGLLPDVREAIARTPVPDLNDYTRVPITAALDAAARGTWPYAAQSLMAVNSGYEGLMFVLQTFIKPGDKVLVENPSPPRLLDLVDATGARTVFLPRDEEGIEVDALREALTTRPAALVTQPNLHNPRGPGVSRRRRDALAEVLEPTGILVVEDDGAGLLAQEPVHALAAVRPERHLYIRSFSKSHGPDLRLAVIEGPEDLMARVHAYHGFGSRWSSRILQDALATMLTDPKVQAQVREAMGTYTRRRNALLHALAEEGVAGPAPGPGLDIWLPVEDEQWALITLAAHGIAVRGGSRFGPKGSAPHVRVSTTSLHEVDAATVARALARATRQRR
jgi:DNA-binding transcriptional MocR family regulator